MPHLCYTRSMNDLHIPRLGRISGWRLRRWIERAPLRAAFKAKMKEWNHSPLNFAVLDKKKKMRSAWNSDRITLRRAAGVLARRMPWQWKNAGQVLSNRGPLVSIIRISENIQRAPKTRGGVLVR